MYKDEERYLKSGREEEIEKEMYIKKYRDRKRKIYKVRKIWRIEDV